MIRQIHRFSIGICAILLLFTNTQSYAQNWERLPATKEKKEVKKIKKEKPVSTQQSVTAKISTKAWDKKISKDKLKLKIIRNNALPALAGVAAAIDQESVMIKVPIAESAGLFTEKEIFYDDILRLQGKSRKGKGQSALIGALAGAVIGIAIGATDTSWFTGIVIAGSGIIFGGVGAIVGNALGGTRFTLDFSGDRKQKSIQQLQQHKNLL